MRNLDDHSKVFAILLIALCVIPISIILFIANLYFQGDGYHKYFIFFTLLLSYLSTILNTYREKGILSGKFETIKASIRAFPKVFLVILVYFVSGYLLR